MCDSDSPHRFTRVIVDDDRAVQLAQLQSAMRRIQTALANVPDAERYYLGNALLNLAVDRILYEVGPQRTAGMLLRLSDAVQTQNVPPEAANAIDLGALHG